jgi:hypothetical protein
MNVIEYGTVTVEEGSRWVSRRAFGRSGAVCYTAVRLVANGVIMKGPEGERLYALRDFSSLFVQDWRGAPALRAPQAQAMLETFQAKGLTRG